MYATQWLKVRKIQKNISDNFSEMFFLFDVLKNTQINLILLIDCMKKINEL